MFYAPQGNASRPEFVLLQLSPKWTALDIICAGAQVSQARSGEVLGVNDGIANEFVKKRCIELVFKFNGACKTTRKAGGFIQNRRDAPLLLQWGEGDFNLPKVLLDDLRLGCPSDDILKAPMQKIMIKVFRLEPFFVEFV
jgi:hypothetical protein